MENYNTSNQPTPSGFQASEEEKSIFFGSAASIFMLIFCITSTINMIIGLISFQSSILDVLIVIGLWITYANAKKNNLKTTGISLIKVPYTIKFVFSVFSFIGSLIVCFISFNIVTLLTTVVSFVVTCMCYSSINKTLKVAKEINLNHTVRGQKAGMFAGIIMIINAVVDFVVSLVGSGTLAAIGALLEQLGLGELAGILSTSGTLVTIASAITLVVSICGAIVILQFGKKLKEMAW